MPAAVELALRGRGTRRCGSEELVLISAQGIAPPAWAPATLVAPGDFVGVQYGGEWPDRPAKIEQAQGRPLKGSEKAIVVPSSMTDGLAFFLGCYLSEGHTTRSNWSVILTNSVEGVLLEAQRAIQATFGLRSRLTHQPGRCTGLVTSSKRLVEFMDALGCGSRASNKRVPEVISTGTRAHALRFLQGAALDGYTTHASAGKWAICLESRPAIDGLQDLLSHLGVVNAQIGKFNKQMQKTYYELYAPGPWGQELCRLVPFLEPDKAARAAEYRRRPYRTGLTDVMPGITGRELYEAVPRGRPGRSGRGTGRQAFTHLCDPRTERVSRASIVRARDAGAQLPQWLTDVLDREIRFVPVVAVGVLGCGATLPLHPAWTRVVAPS